MAGPPDVSHARLPVGQFVRYLVVGGWNTAFGYGVFAALNYALTGLVPHAYMVANALASIAAITMAYAGYKLFVFKTKGNYLREYLRFYVVYGSAALLGFALLPILVALLGQVIDQRTYVPYVAQAILIPVSVLFSFVGHKRYSFKPDAT